jgi:hypothetical protein
MYDFTYYYDPKLWCGDLYFQRYYYGYFHGYLRDIEAPLDWETYGAGAYTAGLPDTVDVTPRGVLIYVGVYSSAADVVDFTDPFVAAHLEQMWNPGPGASDVCGLSCLHPAGPGGAHSGKPVIYLYPEQEQEVTVQLDFDGQLVTTYPEFDEELGGWRVIARPDGTLVDVRDGQEYSYIFWNGINAPLSAPFTEGFVVRGEDTVSFLQSTLAEIGLRPEEYNELIIYWLPWMEHHPFNLIHFAGEEYTSIARMTVTPEPDSLLRVFMVFKELSEPVSIPGQTFEPFERDGFSVVEWGGSEIAGDWHVVR